MAKYVAVVEAFAVRDVQYCATENTDQMTGDWQDDDGAEIFIGIFAGDREDVLEEASEAAGTVPENIRLINVNSDADE